MLHKHNSLWSKFWIGVALLCLAILLPLIIWLLSAHNDPQVETVSSYETQLKHRRQIWKNALEWCESRGIKEVINPKDRDGTPSWYSAQFKPTTFLNYGIKYKLIPTSTTEIQVMELMKDYDLTWKIIDNMIDDPKVVWKYEFPDCVTKFVGPPPVK